MKKFIIGVLLLPALLQAEPVTVDKRVVCGDPKELLSDLVKKYGEQIIWYSRLEAGKNQFAIFVNTETGTWTIVEQVKDKLCVLGDGTGYSYKKLTESKNNI